MSAIDSLLGALRDQAVLADRGYFTLDGAEAREKLRSYQLGDPHRWIASIVRAAVLRGATMIDVRCERSRVRVSFDGAPFVAEELTRMWAATFTASGAAHERALGELALACNAALALLPDELRLTAPAGEGAVVLRMCAGADETIEDDDRPTARTVVELVGGRGWSRERAEAALLRDICRWSPVPVNLDGDRISFGMAAESWALREPLAGGLEGVGGLLTENRPGRVVVLQHGVVLIERTTDAMPRGCLAVVDGGALRTDVSRREPVDDAAFATVMHEACAAARRAMLRAGAALGEAGHTMPSWLPAALRATLAAAGAWRHQGDAFVTALAGLPLWRRADGGVTTIARAVTTGVVRYLRTPPADAVPPDFASALVVDEAAAAALVAIVPAAIDVEQALRLAFERRARREAERALAIASRGHVEGEDVAPVVVSAADLARARFLERPQRWHAHPGAGIAAAVERTADDLHCVLAIAPTRDHGPNVAAARVEVRRERRVLVELRLRCPIANVVAIVSSSTIPTHGNWSALADAATHARVVDLVADALGDAIASLVRGDDRSEGVRRVLAQAAAAALPGAAWLRVWGEGLAREPEGPAVLARLLAARDVLGDAVIVPWLEACREPPFADALARALAEAALETTPPRSLRACAVPVLEPLIRAPLFGAGAQARALTELPALADGGAQLPALRAWERALVKEIFGAAHALASVARPTSTAAAATVIGAGAASSDAADHEGDDAAPDADDTDDTDDTGGAIAADAAAPAGDGPTPAPVEVAAVAEAASPTADGGDPIAAPVPDDGEPAPDLRSPAQRLVEWVAAALHDIVALDAEVPIDPRMSQLEVRPIEMPTLARVEGASVLINRSHDAVTALLESEQPLEAPLSLVVSAVYTAVNYELDEITDAHELSFLLAHARWARRAAAGAAP